jgi:hypothetical protein
MFTDEDIPQEYSSLGKFGELMWYMEKEKSILSEGLIASYPSENVISMLIRKYGNIITHIQSDPFVKSIEADKTSGISLYIKKTELTGQTLQNIKKDVDVYGYFIAFVKKYNILEMGIFIEPKFPFILNKKYLKGKKLYHTTNIKNLKKIEKIGLTPKDSQTTFNHLSNRIYLMVSKTPSFIDQFKTTLAKNKNWLSEDMITFEVDPSNLELYVDPNFDNDVLKDVAVFTFKNIPPHHLKRIS